MTDNIKPDHYRTGEIDLFESWYLTYPFNEFRAIMSAIAERYMKRDKDNRIQDLDKAMETLKRLKEYEEKESKKVHDKGVSILWADNEPTEIVDLLATYENGGENGNQEGQPMKIEIEKPVIPQFVADWIEQLYGQGFDNDDLLEALFSRNYDVAELKIFEWFTDDKERAVTAILYGYEIEQEPIYYAKIKGWELATSKSVFWNYISFIESPMLPRLYTGDKEDKVFVKNKMTTEKWNKVGINDTNADFERVE